MLVCLPLAAPIGLSPLLILTLCGSERVLVVSTEPLDDLSCLEGGGGLNEMAGSCFREGGWGPWTIKGGAGLPVGTCGLTHLCRVSRVPPDDVWVRGSVYMGRGRGGGGGGRDHGGEWTVRPTAHNGRMFLFGLWSASAARAQTPLPLIDVCEPSTGATDLLRTLPEAVQHWP